LGPGWTNWSWNTTVNLAATSPSYNGLNALGFTFNGAWSGLSLHSSGLNATGYNILHFVVNGGSGSGQQTQIALYNASLQQLTPPTSLSPYIEGGSIVAGQWKQVNIPLSALKAVNQTVTGVMIQDASGHSQPTIYLDNLGFIAASGGGPSPTPGLTSTPKPTSTPAPTNTVAATATQVQAATATATSKATATATPAKSSYSIYSDSLANGWADWSWSTTANFNNTSPVYSGSDSIAATYNAAWAGLNLHNSGGINTTGYANLQFYVNGGSASGQSTQIIVYDASSTQIGIPLAVNQFIQGGSIAGGQWRLVTIPLSSLGATNRVITGFALQSVSTSAQPTFYIDSIDLVGSGQPNATATSVPVGSATSTPAPTQPPSGSTNSMNGLHVSGSKILNGAGQTVLIHGVNRMSSEYSCWGGWGFWDGGTPNQTEINNMKAWNIDAVRIPLNEDCWLGINGAPAAYSGTNYQNAMADYVALLQSNNMVAIVDLHWAAPGSSQSRGQQAMADQDHAPAFWTSVANRLKGNSNAIFDLYNEPYPSSWSCLRDGGSNCGASFPIAGMQSLLNAVRSTGATNPIMVGGLGYSHDLSQWTAYKPTDTLNPPQVIASWHNYNDGIACGDLSCWSNWDAAPIIGGEIGELDCGHSYIDSVVSTLNSHNQGYLAWSWGPYSCGSNPALTTDWNGTPTQTYGQGYKNDIANLSSFR
jgi:hypothetical protein